MRLLHGGVMPAFSLDLTLSGVAFVTLSSSQVFMIIWNGFQSSGWVLLEFGRNRRRGSPRTGLPRPFHPQCVTFACQPGQAAARNGPV